jgi:hypothetical protein
MNKTQILLELRELSAHLIKNGLLNDDLQMVFIGNALSTVLDSSASEESRSELSSLLQRHLMRKIQRKAGLNDLQILLNECLHETSPN